MEYCGGGSLQDIYHGKMVVCLKISMLNRHPLFWSIILYDTIERVCLCTCAVTGPLSELQIAYVCRETLQVRSFKHSHGLKACSHQGL